MRKDGHEIILGTMTNSEDFSVLMSVYRNDKPADFKEAVNSIWHRQTLKPAEFVLMVDGPVPEPLDNVICSLEQEIPVMRVIRLESNSGLGEALRIGVEKCSHPIIARMDSDDIAIHNRFELQYKYLKQHPNVSILGGQIDEFIDNSNNIVSRREVPTASDELKSYTRARCPFNHMTVMFRRESILEAGNYQSWHYNEDYYLWIRLLEQGYVFANLPDTLVNVRVGTDMYKRRGGWKYFKSEKGLQDYMLRHRLISLPRYLYNTAGRFLMQVVLPNNLRGFLFQKLFRE